MKKYFSLVILFLLSILFIGCGRKLEIGAVAEQNVNTYNGVTMKIVEGTTTTTGTTIEILNQTESEINSGNRHDFSIEVEKDGKWHEIQIGECNNTSEAVVFLKDNPVQMEISWRNTYGVLPKGDYRIVKGFFPWTEEKGNGGTFVLAAEFCVE